MEIKEFNGIKLLLLLGLISLISPCSAQEIPNHAKAQIGFGSTLNDTEIIEILQRHTVSPKAAFMWISGISGTHRTFVEVSAEEFVEGARTHFINSILKGWEAKRLLIKDFIETHSEEEIYYDETLQIGARSILNIVKQAENALATLQSRMPILYGIEVDGEYNMLEEIRNEPKVRASFLSEDIKTSNKPRWTSIKPEAYRSAFTYPSVLTASPSNLYQLLLKDLRKLEKVNNKQGGAND